MAPGRNGGGGRVRPSRPADCPGELILHADGALLDCSAGCLFDTAEAAMTTHRWMTPCRAAEGRCARCAKVGLSDVTFSPGVFGTFDVAWVERALESARGLDV